MDNPKFNTETELKIQLLADHILKFHGLKHRFTYKQLRPFFQKNKISAMNLYALKCSGAIDNPQKWVYILNFHDQTIGIKAYKDLARHQKEQRVMKNKTVTPHPEHAAPVEKPTIVSFKITESQAIEFLKRLGYKIMKPTTSFEEV